MDRKRISGSSKQGAPNRELQTGSSKQGAPNRKLTDYFTNLGCAVLELGTVLITAVLPAANKGPNLRVILAAGKFQGVRRPQTPTGCLKSSILRFELTEGMASPLRGGASSAIEGEKQRI